MLITSVTGPCNPITAVTLASQKLASVQRCSVSSSFRAAEKYRPDSGAFTSQVQYLHPHCTIMEYIHTFIQEPSNILMWTKNCIMEKRLNSKIQCLKIDDLQSQVWHISWFWKSATHCVFPTTRIVNYKEQVNTNNNQYWSLQMSPELLHVFILDDCFLLF